MKENQREERSQGENYASGQENDQSELEWENRLERRWEGCRKGKSPYIWYPLRNGDKGRQCQGKQK